MLTSLIMQELSQTSYDSIFVSGRDLLGSHDPGPRKIKVLGNYDDNDHLDNYRIERKLLFWGYCECSHSFQIMIE